MAKQARIPLAAVIQPFAIVLQNEGLREKKKDKKYTNLNRGIFGRCVQKISMCPVKNGIQATPVGEKKNTKENQHSAR